MLYREIIAVCSEIHTKHINSVRGQNVELLNVKPAVRKVTTGLKWLLLGNFERSLITILGYLGHTGRNKPHNQWLYFPDDWGFSSLAARIYKHKGWFPSQKPSVQNAARKVFVYVSSTWPLYVQAEKCI